MNVIITGGAGFIGKHLARDLLEKGFTVTVFDNFSNSNKKSIASLVDIGARIIEGDITNLQSIINATRKQHYVVHLAARISVEDSIRNPSETFRVNVDGTKNVLEACKKNAVNKLIAISSAAVYGEGVEGIKLTENSRIRPISPYGESKALMEQEIKKFSSKYGLNYTILRLFNVYGVGQSDEYAGVITKFIKNIAKNESLEIFGNGLQTRDFVAVQDVVASIQNAMTNGSNKIYNIASGKSITIKELAEFMISLSRKNLDIKYLQPREGDINYSQADIFLAKKELKYTPKHDFDEIKNLL
jgi:UDP-glucose 4-epimerase